MTPSLGQYQLPKAFRVVDAVQAADAMIWAPNRKMIIDIENRFLKRWPKYET